MVGVSFVDYSMVLKYHWIAYIATIIFLFLVLFAGDDAKGAQRWLEVGALRFQPSELAKVLLVLFFARFLMDYTEELNKWKTIAFCALLGGVPLLLILKEPDLSTTIVTFMMIFTMMFFAGLSYKIIVPLIGVGFVGVVAVIYSILHSAEGALAGYQNDRILAWLMPDKFPDKARQQQNSIMAIGSGQLFGKGLYNNGVDSVKNGNYIPEPHTDFIFAVAGEELGFIGSALIIILLFIIVYECIRTAKLAKDLAGQLVCIGIASMIGFQAFVNICVVTGLMPNTGLTLPFVSYGLTSLVTLYFGIGFVLNVSLQAKKFYEI